MNNKSRLSLLVVQILVVSLMVALFGRLFYLQVIDERYRQLAMDNAVYAKVIYPERGIIYDRKGKAILNNNIIYDFRPAFPPYSMEKLNELLLFIQF